MGPQTGNVHWGLERSECRRLSRLDALLNRTYQNKMRSLPPKDRLSLRNSQRVWLARLNESCWLGNDAKILDEATSDCFAAEVQKRVSQLQQY
ncbi:lysozyme inhibitor LprI family protein [Novosphingobium percolationis]|uniref:lysozyme inhibitor LprI family protein n=1 Tax=Novosphingobium percolationis TaxID=2871811 RepID=UPI001CD54AFB